MLIAWFTITSKYSILFHGESFRKSHRIPMKLVKSEGASSTSQRFGRQAQYRTNDTMCRKVFSTDDRHNIFIEGFSQEKDVQWRKSISCRAIRDRENTLLPKRWSHSLPKNARDSFWPETISLKRTANTCFQSLETFGSWWFPRNRTTVPAIFDIITETAGGWIVPRVNPIPFTHLLENSILCSMYVDHVSKKII